MGNEDEKICRSKSCRKLFTHFYRSSCADFAINRFFSHCLDNIRGLLQLLAGGMVRQACRHSCNLCRKAFHAAIVNCYLKLHFHFLSMVKEILKSLTFVLKSLGCHGLFQLCRREFWRLLCMFNYPEFGSRNSLQLLTEFLDWLEFDLNLKQRLANP